MTKKLLIFCSFFIVVSALIIALIFILDLDEDTSNKSSSNPSNSSLSSDKEDSSDKPTSAKNTDFSYINKTGTTLETRINTPEGYKRTAGDEYAEFLRKLEVLPDGSPVMLYNGEEKSNQDVHVAVLNLDVGNRDLQQCADSALRLRCEYLFKTKQYDKIKYHLTNGFELPYVKYRDGYRLKVSGNNTTLVKSAEYSDSYQTFRNYCDVLFAYAGTLSISKESTAITKENMKPGDIFIYGGTPGHCVIVMDMCENADGDKLFLLVQGYMPAQQLYILKNPSSESPWYSLKDLSYPFKTPEYTFNSESLMRMP